LHAGRLSGFRGIKERLENFLKFVKLEEKSQLLMFLLAKPLHFPKSFPENIAKIENNYEIEDFTSAFFSFSKIGSVLSIRLIF